MFLGVRELERRKLRFDVAFAPGEIDFGDARLRQAGALNVEGSAELLAAIVEIRVSGRIRGAMVAECDRCLEPAPLALDGAFDLSYRPSDLEPRHEVALDGKESEVDFFEGDGIELAGVVREQVLLALPMQRLCCPDCRGICPVCGQNRNRSACACQPAPADGRWAGLDGLSLSKGRMHAKSET